MFQNNITMLHGFNEIPILHSLYCLSNNFYDFYGEHEKEYQIQRKFDETSNRYIEENTLESSEPKVSLTGLKTTGPRLTAMKRRFQRNRTSFGAEQISILEKGKYENFNF